MQSEEVEYPGDEDEDDELCDCAFCRAERAEQESATEQVTIDRISDTEWKICDSQEKGHPLAYILYVNQVQRNPFENMSFTLVECDSENFNSEFEGYQTFKREIWSASMYVGDTKRFEETAEAICTTLNSIKISNPIELAYFFGGVVHHRNVNMPPVPDSH